MMLRMIIILMGIFVTVSLHAEEDKVSSSEKIELWQPQPHYFFPTLTLQQKVPFRGRVVAENTVLSVKVELWKGKKPPVVSDCELYYKEGAQGKEVVFHSDVKLQKGYSWAVIHAKLEGGRTLESGMALPVSVSNNDYNDLASLTSRKLHRDAVKSLAFTPDKRFLISASDDGSIRISDPHSLDIVHSLRDHRGYVHDIAVTLDSQYLVSGGEDRILRLWDIQTGKLIERFSRVGQAIRAVAVSPDGQYAVSGGHVTPVVLWDLQAQKKVREFSDEFIEINVLRFSPDSRYVFGGTDRGEIMIWDVATGKVKYSRSDAHERILSLALHPSMRFLYTSGREGEIRWWRCLLNSHKTDPAWEDEGDLLWEMRLFVIKDKKKDIADVDPATLSETIRKYPFYYMKKKPADWKPTYEKKTIHPYSSYGTPIIDLAISATGEHFLLVSEEGDILIHETFTGNEEVDEFINETLWAGTLSHDGSLVAVGDIHGKIYVFGVK